MTGEKEVSKEGGDGGDDGGREGELEKLCKHGEWEEID